MTEHYDVIVVGAGISGIGAGYWLKTRCPDRSYAILEGRERIGGTWDLFRYPGIRSDSDMYTLGFRFKPWTDEKAIADGASILEYLEETAREFGIDEHIRYQHWVTKASWSTERARWTVTAERKDTGETVELTCNFLFMCSGYYDYDAGHEPVFEGAEDFRGRIVHPQKWTDDIEYAGKKVVVIGSGATAITLVPELAKQAAHVTMLQRSPTYIVSMPARDKIARALHELFDERTASFLTRWKNVVFGQLFYLYSRKAPQRVRKMILDGVRRMLGPDFDVETHFSPRYDPWDQRLCLVPDGDLFEAIKRGDASVVTDHIDRFTETGIRLRSGEELEADLIVTATGLKLKLLGGVELYVDGKRHDPAESMSYKAMMLSDVPNLAMSFGYTNASWTLKSDLTGEYVCRLLNHMKEHGYEIAVPRRDERVQEEPFLSFSSGYVQRALHLFPKQGDRAPWKLYMNYFLDMIMIRHGKIDDGVLEWDRARSERAAEPREVARDAVAG